MMTLEEYRQDPCGKLSMPLWKWNSITVPDNLTIIHHRDYLPRSGCSESRFFRLYHDLCEIPKAELPGLEINQIGEGDYDTVVDIIRTSYPGIQLDREWLEGLTRTPVYTPELWLMARWDGVPAGCVLADYDQNAQEGILEWVQVMPAFRRRGVGKALVCEALRRMQGDFVTVSGDLDNKTSPELLYRSCGFTGDDLWHIVRNG